MYSRFSYLFAMPLLARTAFPVACSVGARGSDLTYMVRVGPVSVHGLASRCLQSRHAERLVCHSSTRHCQPLPRGNIGGPLTATDHHVVHVGFVFGQFPSSRPAPLSLSRQSPTLDSFPHAGLKFVLATLVHMQSPSPDQVC
jgi:hypothetical protein